jgi:hypothetical protein
MQWDYTPKVVRGFHYFIDTLVIYAFTYCIFKILHIPAIEIYTIDDLQALDKRGLLIQLIVQFIYYCTLEYTTGTTTGKLLTGARVVSTHTNNSFMQYITRTLIRFIPLYPLLVLFMGNNTWHDKWSHTKVVPPTLPQL